MSSLTAVSQFRLVGQLESFVMKEGDKVKYVRIKVIDREYWIKISKKLRQQVDLSMSPGTWLEIIGNREPDGKLGLFKLEATTLKTLSTPDIPCATVLSGKTDKSTNARRILVCQKSDCWERGGKRVCQQLEKKLSDRGLGDLVEIQLTGCLKQCKKGPNVVVLPDKTRYSQVKPYQVEELLDKHF
ncbi:(2Fe-2S) ferredoxin domain-containing protein [Aphanothece sacrum]|uniref:OB-fold tRNA/helicase-type nucleic acid binding-protein n=1 Tax=Aphanothece sacrum FPU1 TaxID=1920663 RepID=A0A401INN1_APHSA|nr:(2Fe-2S) ferredoxin domain-containing protein [Aphanothece sacrum]GBF82838.1 OB-fold tRNA/helicase-type nucleic acid binding-protein [Aphanothece sacrum FPU1]GBF85927.1 OB-fold tRNA/helicase-type nucleic acid binding-protein [Aphanothece sacrum FPU3]